MSFILIVLLTCDAARSIILGTLAPVATLQVGAGDKISTDIIICSTLINICTGHKKEIRTLTTRTESLVSQDGPYKFYACETTIAIMH